MNKKDNAFSGAAGGLGAGIDALFATEGNPNEFDLMANLDDIEIVAQVREEFESEGNELALLGKSLRKRQLQAILLRHNVAGAVKPWLLVAGERRVRAARIEGLTQLRARVAEMDDAEAEDMQLAENIHRKNLTQIEEAKKIQRDLDELGNVDAVLEKHQKSRGWLSKILSLLNLPEQAKRLVTENVSADIEVINTVKTIENHSPEKAKALVDDLKKTRGKENAREKVAAVKEEVKPSKKPKAPKADKENKAGSGQVATEKDRTAEEPGPVSVFAGEKIETVTEGKDPFADDQGEATQDAPRPVAFAPAEVLTRAYNNIFEFGAAPKMILETMTADDKDAVEGYLHSFYDAGTKATDSARAVIQGFRNGQFATENEGAFALVAFLYGADSDQKFNLLNIFGSVKS